MDTPKKQLNAPLLQLQPRTASPLEKISVINNALGFPIKNLNVPNASDRDTVPIRCDFKVSAKLLETQLKGWDGFDWTGFDVADLRNFRFQVAGAGVVLISYPVSVGVKKRRLHMWELLNPVYYSDF